MPWCRWAIPHLFPLKLQWANRLATWHTAVSHRSLAEATSPLLESRATFVLYKVRSLHLPKKSLAKFTYLYFSSIPGYTCVCTHNRWCQDFPARVHNDLSSFGSKNAPSCGHFYRRIHRWLPYSLWGGDWDSVFGERTYGSYAKDDGTTDSS